MENAILLDSWKENIPHEFLQKAQCTIILHRNVTHVRIFSGRSVHLDFFFLPTVSQSTLF